MPGVAHRDGGDPVLERPLGREVGRERADDLPERPPAVERERRALVAHDLGPCRGHDRAVAPAVRVLPQAPQPVARMAADLGAHEQLRDALGVLGARAHALDDVAGEAQRFGGGERARHARTVEPTTPGEAAR